MSRSRRQKLRTPTSAPPAPQAATEPPSARAGTPWVAFALLAALGLALFARCLLVRFVGDDYILLDAAKRLPFVELLSGRHGIPGFYRPVSRELYFWWWGRVLDLGPGAFHLVNAGVWAAAGALFFLFLRRWLGARTALLGLAAFVLFPPAGALLSWVSCAQDLIALFWCVAALALYQRGRHGLAGLAVALAALSKETAVPFAATLAAWEWTATPRATLRERLVRLRPALIGIAASLGVSILARAMWPAGRAVAVWSPGQVAEAWRLPADLASTFAPPHTLEGIAAAWREVPLGLVLPALLALALPFAAPRRPATADVRGPAPPRSVLFGLAVTLLGALPVAVIVERWRGYYFSIAWLGVSILVALALGRLRPWLAGPLLAAAALASYGSNSVYRPLTTGEGPGRHAHANYTFFREGAAITGQMLATLEPLCDSLRSVPRAFAQDLPPGVLYDTVIGAALRVTCRDTTERLRRIEAFRTADASAPFALLRFDPADLAFEYRRAGAADRTELGQAFLEMGRVAEAAACFAAARAPGDSLARPLGSRGALR